jgi:hypothetical protein
MPHPAHSAHSAHSAGWALCTCGALALLFCLLLVSPALHPASAAGVPPVMPSPRAPVDAVQQAPTQSAAAPALAPVQDTLAVTNTSDHRTRFRWLVRLHQIVGPSPHAIATLHVEEDCADCRTIGILVQINLVSDAATSIASETYATSHMQCAGGTCITMGLVAQYTVSVPNPLRIPRHIARLTWLVVARLHSLFHARHLTLQRVLAGFNSLARLFLHPAPVLRITMPSASRRAG